MIYPAKRVVGGEWYSDRPLRQNGARVYVPRFGWRCVRYSFNPRIGHTGFAVCYGVRVWLIFNPLYDAWFLNPGSYSEAVGVLWEKGR